MCFVSTYSIILPYRAQRYSGLSLQIHVTHEESHAQQSQRCGAKDNERLFVVQPHQFFLLVELDGGGCGGGCSNGGGGMITQSTKPYRIMPNDADKNHHTTLHFKHCSINDVPRLVRLRKKNEKLRCSSVRRSLLPPGENRT